MDAQRRHQAPSKSADQSTSADPEVMRLISEVENHLQGLRRVHAEHGQTKAHLDQRRAEIETRAREQKELQESLAAREEEARRAADAVVQRRAELDFVAAALAEVEKDSKERIARAAEERQAVESIAADLGVREKSLGERAARFDQIQAEVRALKHRLAETERTAAERAQEVLRSQDEATEMARRLQEFESIGPAAERQAAVLRAEVEKANQCAASAESGLASRQQAIDALTERCRALEQRLAEEGRAQSASADTAAQFQARLDDAAASLAALTAERDQGAAEALRYRREAADLQARLDAAARELRQAADARDEAGASLAGATAEVEDLSARVAALQEQAEALRLHSASRAARADGGLKIRRKRMQRCRFLLRERSNKIRQAGEMLKARHQQYEQVLSMRGEVISAKRAVDALAKKVQAAGARTRAASAIFYLSGLVAVLGALSWAITRQMVPATYVARAVIVPEVRNKTLSESELADWQSYHESLLTDPQFLETAAERMARRGITTLGTAGDLRAELDKSFDSQSARNGQLVLELRGLGSDRTQRVLDTYVTALVSSANAGKEHRSDGAATAISEPARCAATPIEDPRPLYAAGLLGGSTVLFLLVGGVIWGRLAAAKNKFETEARIDEFVEAPAWPAANAPG